MTAMTLKAIFTLAPFHVRVCAGGVKDPRCELIRYGIMPLWTPIHAKTWPQYPQNAITDVVSN
jgi:hypothetical protein